MSETIAALLMGLLGVVVLMIGSIVLTLKRSTSQQSISWHGFGVTFRITPCGECRALRKEE